MTPERWAQIEELFYRAAESDPQHRAAILDRACGGDSDLRAQVEALLSSDQSARSRLQNAVRSEFESVAFSLTGTTVSHYRIQGGIGGGGMGLVYQAEDIKLGRPVAIKFLPENAARHSDALRRFEREARSASALEHPNICPIYEFGEHEGQPFLVMQLLEGQTLREFIALAEPKNSSLEIRELLDIAIQISAGLDAAHKQGIIHRDIKPANIFVTKQGHAKILDFGLAKLTQSVEYDNPNGKETEGEFGLRAGSDLNLSRTGVAMGTMGYMSPEQVRGEKVDSRTDLFSFGLVLYEMATGKRAFNGDSVPGLRHTMLHEVPTAPRRVNPAVPAKLERVINKALEKDRNNRYRSAAEIRADLETLRGEIEPRALRGWAVASSVILVFMAIASFWFFKKQSRSGKIAPEIRVRQLTVNSADNRVINGAISPNGKYLAYVDLKGMHLQIVDAGETRAIPMPDELRNHKVMFECITWSPDNIHFLCNAHPAIADRFGVTENDRVSIWEFSVSGGKPHMLRDMAIACCFSPNGSQIAFGTNTTREIWVMDANGANAHKVVESADDSSVFAQVWSADSERLIYSRERLNTLFNVLSRDLQSGATAEIETNFWKDRETENVLLLPDGRNLFGRVEPGAMLHSCNFWLARNDLHTGKLIEQPQQLTNWTGFCMHPTSATADGKKIAFLQYFGHPTVDVADLRSGGKRISNLRHLAQTETFTWPDGWTPDSKGLIFHSAGGSRHEIYRQSLNGDSPELLVQDSIALGPATVSPDGKWVLYIRDNPAPSNSAQLMRVPIGSGSPQPVFSLQHPEGEPHCTTPPSKICAVFERTQDRKEMVVTAFDPLKGLGSVLTRIAMNPNVENWSAYLSPNGTRIALVLGVTNRIKIFTIRGEPINEIQVKDLTGLTSSSWTADGKALLVSGHVPWGYALFRVSLDGQTHPIIENHAPDVMGALPSPDGSHIALFAAGDNGNMWMMENF
jgi:serine/threonine protein kinase